VTLAKAEFSNSQNANIQKWSAYIKGSANRQDFLEKALDWVSEGNISGYMSRHRNDDNINELKTYFNSVIDWVSSVFTDVKKEMQGVVAVPGDVAEQLASGAGQGMWCRFWAIWRPRICTASSSSLVLVPRRSPAGILAAQMTPRPAAWRRSVKIAPKEPVPSMATSAGTPEMRRSSHVWAPSRPPARVGNTAWSSTAPVLAATSANAGVAA